jgi:CheY-like chemotaxis protein
LKKEVNKKPTGVFVFVDDERDEHFLLKVAMKDLGLHNQVVSCYDGAEALAYLKETEDEIFLILTDLNMPKMDGLELKRMIELTPELKVKAIPFFFHSNSASPAEVRSAYTLNIQGYLRKTLDPDGTVNSLRRIIDLWTDCVHPKDLNK